MKGLLIPFLLVALIGGSVAIASPAPQKPAADSSRASQEDNIREAVIRYQMKNLELIVAYHFIAVNGKNPSGALLQRFRDDAPPVRPVSEALQIKKPMRAVMSRKDQKQGVIFRVGNIKWNSDEKAEVEGGFECGDSCDEASGVYRVTSHDGKWIVESFDSAAKKNS